MLACSGLTASASRAKSTRVGMLPNKHFYSGIDPVVKYRTGIRHIPVVRYRTQCTHHIPVPTTEGQYPSATTTGTILIPNRGIPCLLVPVWWYLPVYMLLICMNGEPFHHYLNTAFNLKKPILHCQITDLY